MPPINASVAAYPTCELGTSSAYTINATNADDVAAGIKFAKENNVRLVIKNTGHDIFQRAITIGGGYVWKDAYDLASKHRHVVVVGGDPTVGCIGGYLQGAGHGSLSHEFGLATDQVIEYKVVLASGKTVTANACHNSDLFTALIGGGGGGTYGDVLSATVKAYPTLPVLYHDLYIAGLGHNDSAVLGATARMASKYPAIVDEGFAGTAYLTRIYGPWVYGSPFIKFLANNSVEAVNHANELMNREIMDDLLPENGTDFLVSSKWSTHPSWAAWYASTHHTSTGNNQPLMISRFFNKESLSGKDHELFDLLQILTNEVGAGVHTASSTVLLNIVAGGKVLDNVPYTSVNPAWRETYLLLQEIDMWLANAGSEEIQKVKEEATKRKLGAMKNLAPGTGTYGNGADPYDPDWKQDWFGDQYDKLLSIKKKYDPEDVFWCWRCVGNEDWEEVTGGALFGPLCQVN